MALRVTRLQRPTLVTEGGRWSGRALAAKLGAYRDFPRARRRMGLALEMVSRI